MGKILDKFNEEVKLGQFPSRSFDASKWLSTSLKRTGKQSAVPVPGVLQFFHYEAKTKAMLPYWDSMPLVLPLEIQRESFVGLNFHYLPLNIRVHLLDQLLVLTEDKRITPDARIWASVGILKGVARFKAYESCVKKYLFKQIRGYIATIEPEGWFAALHMPVVSFHKASPSKAWADAREED